MLDLADLALADAEALGNELARLGHAHALVLRLDEGKVVMVWRSKFTVSLEEEADTVSAEVVEAS